jgi:hypothetical protein
MGPTALLPVRKEGVLRIFIALEPAIFGSSSKHTNHYTTKATKMEVQSAFYEKVPAGGGVGSGAVPGDVYWWVD